MKIRTILTYIFCSMASICFAHIQTGDTLRTITGRDSLIRETVFVHDTIYVQAPKDIIKPEDVMHTKAIGRYDRGIINYRFIPKGKWIGGATASYVDFDSKDSRLLFSLLKNFDCHARTVSVKPFIGYAIRNNITIGAKLGYNHTVAQLDNLALNMDDLDFSLKDIRYTEDTYSLGLFHRSYVGLDAGRRFGLFNETTLSFNTGTTRFSRGKDSAETTATESENTFRSTETTLYELHLGINPGVAVFIMQNVSAEVSFGVIGFKYSSEKQKNNLGETGKRHNSGANFKINLFNINIGITLCL